MPLSDLSSDEQEIVRRCLQFVLRSDKLEGEFQTRLGVSPEFVEQLLARWPKVDDIDDDSDECLAINNALNEVAQGLHVSEEDWQTSLSGTRAEIRGAYLKWAKSRGWKETGIR